MLAFATRLSKPAEDTAETAHSADLSDFARVFACSLPLGLSGIHTKFFLGQGKGFVLSFHQALELLKTARMHNVQRLRRFLQCNDGLSDLRKVASTATNEYEAILSVAPFNALVVPK